MARRTALSPLSADPSRPPRPDFPGRQVAVFVDGCFWHGCPEHYEPPHSSSQYWATKLSSNIERDGRQTRQLESLGWQVIRVWEHEIQTEIDRVVAKLAAVVRSGTWLPEPNWRVYKVDLLGSEGLQERRYLLDLRNPNNRQIEDRDRFFHKHRS